LDKCYVSPLSCPGNAVRSPETGYEIKKRVDTSLRFFTQASYGTLYPTLHRLLQDGAVRMEEDVQHIDPPARFMKSPISAGRNSISGYESRGTARRREFLCYALIGHARSANHLCALLQQRRQAIQAELQAL
jgi:hypothetical protein